MLRIVLMVLVAANLLYFGWAYTVGADKPRLTAATAASSPSGAAKPAQRPAAPPGPPPCATLGPFLDAALADTAEAELKDADLGPVRRNATEQVAEGWWVYV